MSFWTQKKRAYLTLSAYTLHPTLLHSPVLPLVRQKQFLAPLASCPSFTVKPQGNIWFCLSHMWATEGSWSRRVCWLAPLQSHGLAPLLPCTAQPALASPFSAQLSLFHLSFNYIPHVPSNSSCLEGNHDLSHSFILHSVTGWPCHSAILVLLILCFSHQVNLSPPPPPWAPPLTY